jgi:hypothetical protein
MGTKRIEFPFVLDALADIDVVQKRFFGSTAIYRDDRILLILRDREEHTDDNGVWVATLHEHHASLRAEFPSLRSIRLFGPSETTWQNIPLDDPHFERDVLAICEAIVAGDPRIGKVPNARRKGARELRAKRTGQGRKR